VRPGLSGRGIEALLVRGELAPRVEQLEEGQLRRGLRSSGSASSRWRSAARTARGMSTSAPMPRCALSPRAVGAILVAVTSMRDFDARRAVLLDVLKYTETNGWFPARDGFRTRTNREHLEAMVAGGLLTTDENFYGVSAYGLRVLCVDHAFADDELTRATALLQFLQKRLDEKQKGPYQVGQLRVTLGWPEPNEVRRAVYVLARAIPAGVTYSENPAHSPESVAVDEPLWDVDPESLGALPVTPPREHPGHPTAAAEGEVLVKAGLLLAPQMRTKDFVAAAVALPEIGERAKAFDSRGFHVQIADACRKLYVDGHARSAILEGCLVVNQRVREMTGRTEDGDDLMGLVFNDKNPLLTFNANTTETEKSEQRGLMYLFKGMVAALRNPNAHELRAHADEYALECLSLISLLSRYLDDAKP